MHARLERDMLRAVRYNRAGVPPALGAYLSSYWASRFPHIKRAKRVFVPIGLDLRETDARRLRQPTSWDAVLVRTLRLTRGAAGGWSATWAALLDLLLCRNASWFMGWSGSTYARLLGLYQKLDAGRSWYVVCPRNACHVDAGRKMIPHSFCLDLVPGAAPSLMPPTAGRRRRGSLAASCEPLT